MLHIALCVVGIAVHHIFARIICGPCGVLDIGLKVAVSGEEGEGPVLSERSHEEIPAVSLLVSLHHVGHSPAGAYIKDLVAAGEGERHSLGIVGLELNV